MSAVTPMHWELTDLEKFRSLWESGSVNMATQSISYGFIMVRVMLKATVYLYTYNLNTDQCIQYKQPRFVSE